eukprot:CAMPEP_0197470636 /NCGR_PEP_ID=MMETSP1309-20131121/1378_1 /TAXON_ID=464262 /ORGANISM="Genus nov. species nov., Strain RCC998" /LENGTH=156 /DNA_ID=CAMNT_0043007675 /DNA_START=691 /DNA_END=1157 /DNA_ORIENTATION=-
MSSSVIPFVTENLSSSFESFSFDAFRAWAGESSAKTLSPRGFEDSDVLANASFAPSSLSSTGEAEANPFSVSLPFFSREKATTRLPFRPSREDKKLETFDVLVQVQEDAQHLQEREEERLRTSAEFFLQPASVLFPPSARHGAPAPLDLNTIFIFV